MANPTISVIIPAHNSEKTLKNCLGSVLAQDYGSYEVIVVDNDSMDGTRDIIKGFAASDKRVKYVSEPHKSRGAARNAGIKAAEGDIITMTDSDCIVPHNWLTELTQPIVSGEEDAVMGFEEDLVGNYWTRNIQKKSADYIERNLSGKYVSHLDTKNFAIRAGLMKELMFDPAIGNIEDFELFLRLGKETRIRFLPHVSVGHEHKTSFVKTARLNFDRGRWVGRIYLKHRSPGIKKLPMFESISYGNFARFPFWMAIQFIKKPLPESSFTAVWEISWRMGLFWAFLSPSGRTLP